MNRKVTLVLALAAGLAGGVFSRYIAPSSAFAQTQPPKEIRAESFVLVDANDNVIGTFRASVPVPKPGGLKRTIVLMDANNQEIWRVFLSKSSPKNSSAIQACADPALEGNAASALISSI